MTEHIILLTQFVLVLMAVLVTGAIINYLKSWYVLIISRKLSIKQSLEYYVTSKYYVKMSLYSFLVSVFCGILSLLMARFELLGASIVWIVISFLGWLYFRRVLGTKKEELERIRNITGE